MELAQHLEDARDLAPRRRSRPSPCRALEVGAEVAEARVLERQVVEHVAVGPGQREAVVDADRARSAIEELAEVRLADPGVDVQADLDADLARDAVERPSRVAR